MGMLVVVMMVTMIMVMIMVVRMVMIGMRMCVRIALDVRHQRTLLIRSWLQQLRRRHPYKPLRRARRR